MIRFINKYTGTQMWVSEERAEEYKAAGHKPAADAAPKRKPVTDPVPENTEEDKPEPKPLGDKPGQGKAKAKKTKSDSGK